MFEKKAVLEVIKNHIEEDIIDHYKQFLQQSHSVYDVGCCWLFYFNKVKRQKSPTYRSGR